MAQILQQTIQTDQNVTSGVNINTNYNIFSNLNKEEDLIVSNFNLRVSSYINKTDSTIWSGSTDTVSSSYYYRNIYVTGNSKAYFSISYGRKNGFESASNTYLLSMKPALAVYSTFKNMLKSFGSTVWTIDGSTLFTSIVVMQFDQKTFKDGINSKLFTFDYNSASYITSTASVATTAIAENINLNNCRYIVQSGSSTPIGLVYGDLGIAVFNSPTAINANSLSKTTLTTILGLFNTGGKKMTVQYIERIKSRYYICRVKNRTFNFSNNPTFVTSDGTIKISSMRTNGPTVYITSIGLYNENGLLLAIAKPNKPIKKNFQTLATIQVKLEY